MKDIHGVREVFNLNKFMDVREKTLHAVDTVKDKLDVGMDETACLKLTEEVFFDMGVEKKWHPTKFRIGKDTLCSFKEKSTHFEALTEGEIYFIDIGPVWDNHEGDIGRTFVFGEDKYGYLKLANDAKTVFDKVAVFWRENEVGGTDLYRYAQDCAKELGHKLNLKMAGHRLGDFPHHLFYRGSLGESVDNPVANLWVLEILIANEEMGRGAFFEDILRK